MKLIFISDIDMAHSPHVRAGISDDTVEEYAEAMKAKDKFPPVILFDCGNKQLLVGDGLHRIAAQQSIKRKVIEADVRRGTIDDALLFALAANNKHGMRRSSQDKRAGVFEALTHWPNRTDNYLAEVCFVSNHLVKEVRDSMVERETLPEAPIRTTKDGRKLEATKPKPSPPRKDDPILDETGWVIPKQLLPMWYRNVEVQAILTELSKFKGVLRRAQESKDPLWGEVLFSNALADLEKVYENIATAKGHAVCHVCAGRPDIQPKKCCPTCKSKGLLSRFRWNTVVPAEIKKIRQQTKQKDNR